MFDGEKVNVSRLLPALQSAGLCITLALLAHATHAQTPPNRSAWRLSRELTISGAQDGLERPHTMVVLRNSGLVVRDGGTMMISTYDSAGRRVGRAGGRGRGPGELQVFSEDARGVSGDSVWFYDGTQMRIVVYTAKASHVRTTTIAGTAALAGSPATMFRVYPKALLSDGRMLVRCEPIGAPQQRSGEFATTAFCLLSPSGHVTRTVDGIDMPQSKVSKGAMSLVVPFVFVPKRETSADGAYVLYVSAKRGREPVDTVRVTVFRSTGESLYTWQEILRRPSIPDSTFNRAREGQLATARRSGVESAMRDELIRLMPRSYPAVAHAFVTREGRTWIGLHPGGGASWYNVPKPSRYLILSPTGKLEAVVTVPDNVSLVDSFGDRVWGFEEDDDGFRNIVRFKLMR